jgi:hypothetical protein
VKNCTASKVFFRLTVFFAELLFDISIEIYLCRSDIFFETFMWILGVPDPKSYESLKSHTSTASHGSTGSKLSSASSQVSGRVYSQRDQRGVAHPLLTVETEMNGDSNCTYKWYVSFLGWFVGLFMSVQEIFFQPWLL